MNRGDSRVHIGSAVLPPQSAVEEAEKKHTRQNEENASHCGLLRLSRIKEKAPQPIDSTAGPEERKKDATGISTDGADGRSLYRPLSPLLDNRPCDWLRVDSRRLRLPGGLRGDTP